jgi:hypothetical protein
MSSKRQLTTEDDSSEVQIVSHKRIKPSSPSKPVGLVTPGTAIHNALLSLYADWIPLGCLDLHRIIDDYADDPVVLNGALKCIPVAIHVHPIRLFFEVWSFIAQFPMRRLPDTWMQQFTDTRFNRISSECHTDMFGTTFGELVHKTAAPIDLRQQVLLDRLKTRLVFSPALSPKQTAAVTILSHSQFMTIPPSRIVKAQLALEEYFVERDDDIVYSIAETRLLQQQILFRSVDISSTNLSMFTTREDLDVPTLALFLYRAILMGNTRVLSMLRVQSMFDYAIVMVARYGMGCAPTIIGDSTFREYARLLNPHDAWTSTSIPSFVWLIKMHDSDTDDTVYRWVITMLNHWPFEAMKSILCDRGFTDDKFALCPREVYDTFTVPMLRLVDRNAVNFSTPMWLCILRPGHPVYEDDSELLKLLEKMSRIDSANRMEFGLTFPSAPLTTFASVVLPAVAKVHSKVKDAMKMFYEQS